MVADKIKHLREKMGMTQASLAEQLGITRSSVNAWEMGVSVPPHNILWSWHIFSKSPQIIY